LGTASSLHALGEVIAAKGLFCSLYTDRGSHCFHIPKAGEKVVRNVRLGIEHIAAYSPSPQQQFERCAAGISGAIKSIARRLPWARC